MAKIGANRRKSEQIVGNRSMMADMRNYALMIAMAILILYSPVFAVDHLPEGHYQAIWCEENGGKLEVVYPDRTRADCETNTHSVEVEFAETWHSAIGQVLWYAAQSGKRAGIVLIMGDDGSDEKYWIKLNTLVDMYSLPIDLWRMYTY